MVLSHKVVKVIPLLRSLFAYTDLNEPPIFEVPDAKKFKKSGLVCLCQLVKFTQESSYPPSSPEHLELLGTVRLAEFLGMDSFIHGDSSHVVGGKHICYPQPQLGTWLVLGYEEQ